MLILGSLIRHKVAFAVAETRRTSKGEVLDLMVLSLVVGEQEVKSETVEG